jgi:hypothetical protein
MGSIIGPQLVRQPGIAENLAGLVIIVLVDQDPARQDAKRPLDDAHVLVKHEVVNIRAIKQRTDRRNQHDVVGPNQFPQLVFSLYSLLPDNMLLPRGLAAAASSFYGYI